MVDCFLKKRMFRNGWKMEQDKDLDYTQEDVKSFAEKMSTNEIVKNLPSVQREIAKHYLKNTNNVRSTVKKIIDRDLTTQENTRLRYLCFDMAIEQTAMDIKKKSGFTEDELTELGQNLKKKELVDILYMSLSQENESEADKSEQ